MDALINACDAGREGELIFRYIVKHTKAKQPIKRLWLQSMTPTAIRDGFAALRDDRAMLPLADAAVCRSESDWLVGINGTRAMTAFNSKSGGFHLTTVGRVQTPTLAILVEREEKIKKFVSRDYWEMLGTFGAKAGEYPGRWFDENFQRPKEGEAPELRAERVWDGRTGGSDSREVPGQAGHRHGREQADHAALAAALRSDQLAARSERALRLLGEDDTVGLAQALYEKHKVLTYPRTDSRALPEDYIGTVKETLEALTATPATGRSRTPILTNDWVKPNKRIFQQRESVGSLCDHSDALAPKHLNEPKQKLYDMVTKRFLAIFYPAAEFLVTTRITRVEERTVQERRQGDGEPRLAGGLWPEAQSEDQPDARRRCSRTSRSTRSRSTSRRTRPSRRRDLLGSDAARARWKARANWSRTKNCAKR